MQHTPPLFPLLALDPAGVAGQSLRSWVLVVGSWKECTNPNPLVDKNAFTGIVYKSKMLALDPFEGSWVAVPPFPIAVAFGGRRAQLRNSASNS